MRLHRVRRFLFLIYKVSALNSLFFRVFMIKYNKLGSEDKLEDKTIINLIETTLNKKKNTNADYIKYTFYELRVKYNLSEQDTDRFLYLIRTRLENDNYNVYFTGSKYEFRDITMIVQDNELLIAVKEK